MSAFKNRLNRGRFFRLAVLGLLVLVAGAPLARATQWETLFTAQDVRDHLSTPAGRQQALGFCRRMGISKVYIEVFRDGYQADAATLKASRDFFRHAGLQVSGCVTTTGLGKPSTGWKVAACYTHRRNQQHLAEIFRYAAGLFNEVMIDDFFFTDCECSECAAAKGSMSWKQYRDKLMVETSRTDVLGAARAVNPKVRIILKFPQWYDNFQNRGYVVERNRRSMTASGWAPNSATPVPASGATPSNTAASSSIAGLPMLPEPGKAVAGSIPTAPTRRFIWTRLTSPSWPEHRR